MQDKGEARAETPEKQKAREGDERLRRQMMRIRHKVMVLSGKGGVGKSTVAANVAVALALEGKMVGLLDVDFHGPSIPKLLHLEGPPPVSKGAKLSPAVYGENLKVISLGFLVPEKDSAVIWRGPLKMGVIKQLLADVDWGDLDYLIIDFPPGTGDEPLSVAQLIPDSNGALIVTTPQDLSLSDVRKSIDFCRKVKVPILGVIENMSGFVCPNCKTVTDIFKRGGGETMAKSMGVRFLGRVPIDPRIVEASDSGTPFVYHYSGTEAAAAFRPIVEMLLDLKEKTRLH
jgi:Mrp family chromosome partitioning ATPase